MNKLNGKVAIVGVALSEFSKDSGKTELHMACEVIKAALDDAGLVVSDVDGFVKQSEDPFEEHSVTSSMGMNNLTFFGEVQWGGAACAMVLRAAIGVASGLAKCVVVFRPVNGASQVRMVPAIKTTGQMTTTDLLQWTFHKPFGLMTEAGRVAMLVQRYMHEYNVGSEQFGWIPTVCREHGAKNPNSIYYRKPIDINDYLASKVTVDPLRQMDCYEASDCAAAFVITTTEMARDLKPRPAVILGAAQAMAAETEMLNSYYGPEFGGLPEMKQMSQRLFEMAEVTPKDIKVAQMDDSYGPLVPLQLEEMGFCGPGAGAAFCGGLHPLAGVLLLPVRDDRGHVGLPL